MSFRDAISSLSEFLEASPKEWRVPQLTLATAHSTRAAAKMRPPVPYVDYAGLHAKFLLASETNDWDMIDPVEWNDVTYILWTREPALASIPRFQSSYRRFLEASRTARPFKRLIYAYLESYSPEREGIAWAGMLLRKILLQKRHFILDYWRKVDLELELFSTSPGSRKLAAKCLFHPESAMIPLLDLGLSGALERSGYAPDAYGSALVLVRTLDLHRADQLVAVRRLLEWSCTEVGAKKSFLRYPQYREGLFESLLGFDQPPAPARELLGQFFTLYAQAWRHNDPSCPEPDSKSIAAISRLLVPDHAIQ